jgi:hypothetical protein
MSPKSARKPRPSELVLDEIAGNQPHWDLEKHMKGCVLGYQHNPSYGTAVHFALEALWGIARDVGSRAEKGGIDPTQLDDEWTMRPLETLPVPWIWIRALATAWEKYKSEGSPLGRAFGLEGGQGKPPTLDMLDQRLDERAIAHWIWQRVLEARVSNKKFRIEDAIQEAADKFAKSDVTIRRAWRRFGSSQRLRPTRGS